MADRVLVTGISGFIGGHVALELLRAGYAVRGSLRQMARAPGVRDALVAAGADTTLLEFVVLDLSADAGWRQAMEGCRYLVHVASPLLAREPRDRNEVIRPAVEGTRRALAAALAVGVERVVLTSSAAAVQYGHPRERTERFTAADWSRADGPGTTAYTESKTRAELEAWSQMETAGRRDRLVAINPTVVLGPLLDDDVGTSAVLVQRMLAGTVPASPRLSFGIVDVRDVAALHRHALEAAGVGGQRILASAGAATMNEMAEMLASAAPEFRDRLPRFEAPDWLVKAYALFDPEARGAIESLGIVRQLDCAPAQALLGRPFIPPRLAVAATARSLIERHLLRRKKS